MGGKFSDCSAADPRVKDCCHLEGETPIEIRIAFSQQRPAAYPPQECPKAPRAGLPHAALAQMSQAFAHAQPAASERGRAPRGAGNESDLGFDAESFAAPDDAAPPRVE
ncbi:unnamed protein product, partial [Effrenium voratum]